MNNNTIAMQLKLTTNKRKPLPPCAHLAKPTHTLGNTTPYFARMPQTLRNMFIITKTPRIFSSLPTIWSTSIPSKHTLHSQLLTPKPQQSQKNCILTFNPLAFLTLNLQTPQITQLSVFSLSIPMASQLSTIYT